VSVPWESNRYCKRKHGWSGTECSRITCWPSYENPTKLCAWYGCHGNCVFYLYLSVVILVPRLHLILRVLASYCFFTSSSNNVLITCFKNRESSALELVWNLERSKLFRVRKTHNQRASNFLTKVLTFQVLHSIFNLTKLNFYGIDRNQT
jgi:hypothetical protein